MSETKHDHNHPEPHHKKVPLRPYWQSAHRDWRVWVAVFFIGIAITVYVLTANLTLVPGGPPPPVQGIGQ